MYNFRPTATPRAEEIGQYGVDKETQIYPDDPHLFDFDKEVTHSFREGDIGLLIILVPEVLLFIG